MLRGYLELLRPPNVVTAIADVLAGYAVAGRSNPRALPWLIGATVCLYAGGVVLNDFFDRHLDAVERPERPIPSGRVPASSAAALGWRAPRGRSLAALWRDTDRRRVWRRPSPGSLLLYDARAKQHASCRSAVHGTLPRTEPAAGRERSCGGAVGELANWVDFGGLHRGCYAGQPRGSPRRKTRRGNVRSDIVGRGPRRARAVLGAASTSGGIAGAGAGGAARVSGHAAVLAGHGRIRTSCDQTGGQELACSRWCCSTRRSAPPTPARCTAAVVLATGWWRARSRGCFRLPDDGCHPAGVSGPGSLPGVFHHRCLHASNPMLRDLVAGNCAGPRSRQAARTRCRQTCRRPRSWGRTRAPRRSSTRFNAYCNGHHDALALAAPVLVVPGGEPIKNDAAHARTDRRDDQRRGIVPAFVS